MSIYIAYHNIKILFLSPEKIHGPAVYAVESFLTASTNSYHYAIIKPTRIIETCILQSSYNHVFPFTALFSV
jgi:hypothetical protein